MERRYTDREMRLILQKALSPEPSKALANVGEEGLSLAQIKEIGAEVGIDPRGIELAAADLSSTMEGRRNAYVGIPTTLHLQTQVREKGSREIPRHEVLAVIRSTLGRHGIEGGDADAFEWKARDATGGRYVSITPTEGGLRLSVMGNYSDGLYTMGGVVGGAIFVGASAILSAGGLGPAGLLLGAAVIAAIPPRFVYRWWRKREDALMASLHKKLLELLSE